MSADVVVIALPGRNFPGAIVERAFAPYTDDLQDDSWNLWLPGREATGIYVEVSEGELIDGFSINPPPGYEGFPRFWDAIFEVMRQTPTWCLIAGGWEENCCVVQADLNTEEIIEFAGGPERVRVASSAAELAAAAWA